MAEDPNETSFWIFLDLTASEPGFYIVPSWWMKNDIHCDHARYLERHGGHRAKTPDSTHHRITTERITKWRDRWDLVGLG
jgi:hypothetical protein